MTKIMCSNKTIRLDDDGFLADRIDWSEDIAESIAWQQGIEKLTDEQMEIIRFLRENYSRFTVFPIIYYVCGNSFHQNQYFNEQFMKPELAWKIAGLPKLSEMLFVTVECKHYRMEACCLPWNVNVRISGSKHAVN